MIDLAGIMGLHSMINQEQYHQAVGDKFDNQECRLHFYNICAV